MALVLTREQCRMIDRLAVQELGVPSIVLMENAARGAAEVIRREVGDGPVAIVCGGGNNGGDGYAAARHLHRLGVPVWLHAVKPIDALDGDALTNARICQRLKLPIRDHVESYDDAAIVVDALLGTGFIGRTVREPVAAAIRRMNACARPIVALDVPSGLDCDTGEPADPTVRADRTITFLAEKPGFSANDTAEARVGIVNVCDIGLPADWVHRALDL